MGIVRGEVGVIKEGIFEGGFCRMSRSLFRVEEIIVKVWK